MNLSMYYMMLRSAIKGKAELNEVNYCFMHFDRKSNGFKMKVTGMAQKQLVTRDFQELKDDMITKKLCDGVIDYLKIKGDVIELTMEVDFLMKTTEVIATIQESSNTKKLKYHV